MTLEENERQIYNELIKNRCKIYSILLHKINKDTDDYFSLEKNTFTYEPTLDSSLEVIKQSHNSNAFVDQGDGVVSLKGAVLKEGWYNCGLWEMSVDISFDKLAYTGIILLTDADDPFPYRGVYEGWGIKNWEGPVTGTPRLWDGTTATIGNYTKTPNTTLSDGNSGTKNVAWYTLHMKKTSPTTLEVWKNDDINNKVIYEWQELSDVVKVTFGANTNPTAPDGYGSMFIRNFSVTYEVPTNSLTELCEKTKKIKCNTNNSTTVPPQPILVSGNTLAINEFNIHNKIQYCNNVLRYTLRKCGIDFTDEETGELSNKMHELIKFINDIKTTPTIDIDNIYSAYVNPVQLSGNKSIVQKDEAYNLIAEVVDGGAGIGVDFIQKDKQIMYDDGINGNSILTPQNSNITITRESDGTLIYKTTEDTNLVYLDIPDNCIIKFDVIEPGTYTNFKIGSREFTLHYSFNPDINSGDTVKLVIQDRQATYFVNNEQVNASITLHEGIQSFRFSIEIFQNGTDFKYKNLRVYTDEILDENILTNTNGVATFPLISDGKGLKTYYAKVQNVESNQYELWDCIKYDNGTTSNHNDIWTVGTNGTLTRTDTYSQLKELGTGNVAAKIFFVPLKTCIEFDFLQVDGTINELPVRMIQNSTAFANFSLSSVGGVLNEWHHYRLILDGSNTMKIYVDERTNPIERSIMQNADWNADIQYNFWTSDTITELWFKNFKVYSITIEEEPTPTTLTLTSDKDVLSAYDSETATLTATVLDQNGNAMSGESVVFKKGSTTLDTKTTNSSGVATYTYTGTGVGDVTITVECNSLQETYSIEDCKYWNETGITHTSTSTTDTSYPHEISYAYVPSTHYEVSFDYNMQTGFRLYFCGTQVVNVGDTTDYGTGISRNASGKLVISNRTNSTSNVTTNKSITAGTYYTIKIEVEGTTRKVYLGNELIDTNSFNWLPNYTYYFNWAIWEGGTVYMKNIKIKEL